MNILVGTEQTLLLPSSDTLRAVDDRMGESFLGVSSSHNERKRRDRLVGLTPDEAWNRLRTAHPGDSLDSLMSVLYTSSRWGSCIPWD